MKLEKKYTEHRKLIENENDLLTWCMEHGELGQSIINEWDDDANGSMKNYKAGSAKEVLWQCSICGTKYKKGIRIRVFGGMHEPCGRKRGIEKLKEYHRNRIVNSLADARPDLLKEWDYERNSKLGLDPKYISETSGKKVWWICSKCGKSYSKVVRQRLIKNNGCRRCKTCMSNLLADINSNVLM